MTGFRITRTNLFIAVLICLLIAGAATRSVRDLVLGTIIPGYLTATTIRYEVVAKLSVDGISGEGEAVWETVMGYWSYSPRFLGPVSTRGEAIRVRLADGREYYVLRRPQGIGSSRIFGMLTVPCLWQNGHPVSGNFEGMLYVEAWQGPCTVEEVLPDLVSFSDPSDPETIQLIPYDLAGPDCLGTCLSITAERTSAEVTTGLSRFLPWLDDIEQRQDLLGEEYTLLYLQQSHPRGFLKMDFSRLEGDR